MGLDRRQQARGTVRGAQFWTGNVFHGPDQRRKPCHFALPGAPLLHLLDHCLYPVLTPPPDPPQVPTHSPKTRSGLPEKTSDKCDLLHSMSD
jgi:hypothetical protein